jgi:hypothetical protein
MIMYNRPIYEYVNAKCNSQKKKREYVDAKRERALDLALV